MSLITMDALRRRIRLLERPVARDGHALEFGVPEIDGHLPEGGLPQATLHEISGGGPDAVHAACAALFAAGIVTRLDASGIGKRLDASGIGKRLDASGIGKRLDASGIGRPVLWCSASHDLFPPGLAGAGLHPDRMIHAQAGDEKTVLLVMEEALRHPGLAAVVGEVSQLPMTASRRLVLAAEKSGVMALALRRRREGRPEDTGLTAACTRWRITPMPSPALSELLPLAGLGRARWQVELTRCRGGQPKTWMMEACDAQGRLAVPAELADRPAASRPGGRPEIKREARRRIA